MSSINKSNFTNATYSFILTNNITDNASSTSTSAIDRKRRMQSVASRVIRNNQNEARPFKRAKISNAEIMSSSRNNSDPAAGMKFIPAPSFKSSLFKRNNPIINDEWCSFNPAMEATKILAQVETNALSIDEYCNPNPAVKHLPETSSSSSSVTSNCPVEDSDGWCSFNPNIGATRTLAKIETGTLNIAEYFPNNNLAITNEEWELLEPLLPPKIGHLDHPRGFINACIEYLLHEKISNKSLESKKYFRYCNPQGKYIFLKFEDFKNELYEVKRLIGINLTRFHGFLSTRYKLYDAKSPYNTKNIFNEDLNKLVKNYFKTSKVNLIRGTLLLNSSELINITKSDIMFLIYLGVGAGFNNGLRRAYHSNFKTNRQNQVNYIHYIIINTNIVSCLNDYIRKNCPKLKKYWMPHLI